MKVKVKSLSHVRLFATPWTVAYEAPPFMRVKRVLENSRFVWIHGEYFLILS